MNQKYFIKRLGSKTERDCILRTPAVVNGYALKATNYKHK